MSDIVLVVGDTLGHSGTSDTDFKLMIPWHLRDARFMEKNILQQPLPQKRETKNAHTNNQVISIWILTLTEP